MNTDYRIKLRVLLTIHRPKSQVFHELIRQEISIFCSRLERLEGLSNGIYLAEEKIEANEYETP